MIEADEALLDRISETFHHLLAGRLPTPIEIPSSQPDDEVRQVLTFVNRFLDEYVPLARAMERIAEGDLEAPTPTGRSILSLAYRALQSNLRHVTWKTQQIASGRLDEKVDFMGGFSIAFNSMTQQLKDSFAEIERRNQVIEREREKSESLLRNILPARVAEELKETGTSEPQSFENVTVLFSDLVGFTRISAAMRPRDLIAELNVLFTRFDEIMDTHGCERIKSIGDAYLAVCGMPDPHADHARRMVAAAAEMLAFVRDRAAGPEGGWQIRIGVHSGRLVGGIVGVKKYIYDVFGDTINTASRMETASEPMRINVSETTHDLVRDDFAFVPRAPTEVKGKGQMRMYFLET